MSSSNSFNQHSVSWEVDAEQKLRKYISVPALYEQLAEESVELAHACLKMARKLREENYTPKTFDEISADILEEYTDLRLVAQVLLLMPDKDLLFQKLERWLERNDIDV